METPGPAITVAEYAERRAAVLQALEGAAAVVFAGTEGGTEPFLGRWKTDRSFWHLTGIDHEGGAAVLFDPGAEDPEQAITLFLRPRDPESERWYGDRAALDSALKANMGFTSLSRTTRLPSRITEAARRTKRLACLHTFAAYPADVSPDLAVFKKVCERVPGVSLEDRTQLLPALRAVKSPAELDLIKKAVAISQAAYDTALRFIRPGVSEGTIAEAMTAEFRVRGAEAAFEPIVGSGANGTVLHYIDNNKAVEDGELIVIDYGAACGGYASDVTRTLPAGGKFTPEQRDLYQVVLEASLAAISAARPGATFTDLQNAAHRVIAKAGYEDYFIHGIGHHIGAEVHDATPDGPLAIGMVLTVEPGVYLPERGVGVRIEDDILITPQGAEVLTAAIPKTVEAIEAAMARN
jgi:Xaa-Pro aminopeptidase